MNPVIQNRKVKLNKITFTIVLAAIMAIAAVTASALIHMTDPKALIPIWVRTSVLFLHLVGIIFCLALSAIRFFQRKWKLAFEPIWFTVLIYFLTISFTVLACVLGIIIFPNTERDQIVLVVLVAAMCVSLGVVGWYIRRNLQVIKTSD